MVYFIQSGISGPIKIGHTDHDVSKRLTALQTGSWEQLYVTCVIPGDVEQEQELHERFNNDRIRGEWFKPTTELLCLINQSLINNLPVEPSAKNEDHKQKQLIIDQLKYNNNNKAHAATALNMSRSTLYAKMYEFRIPLCDNRAAII